MTKLREITLIAITETLDSLNQPVRTESTRDVIAELKSITRAEYFNGRQGGLMPELSFLISAFDYQDEKIVKFNGKRFAVYRTYATDDDNIELYCQAEGGVTFG